MIHYATSAYVLLNDRILLFSSAYEHIQNVDNNALFRKNIVLNGMVFLTNMIATLAFADPHPLRNLLFVMFYMQNC